MPNETVHPIMPVAEYADQSDFYVHFSLRDSLGCSVPHFAPVPVLDQGRVMAVPIIPFATVSLLDALLSVPVSQEDIACRASGIVASSKACAKITSTGEVDRLTAEPQATGKLPGRQRAVLPPGSVGFQSTPRFGKLPHCTHSTIDNSSLL